MKFAQCPDNENLRIRELVSLGILDSEAEKSFDDITHVAAEICEVPIALITLIDSTRQWFKSKIGITASESPRDVSFCSHTILSAEPLIVEDARTDERFFDNPFVTGNPNVVFYAGFPLQTQSGVILGALCVIDSKPHSLSAKKIEILKKLASQIVTSFELRRHVREANIFTNMMEDIHFLNMQESQDPAKFFYDYLKKGSEVLSLDFGIIGKADGDSFVVEECIGTDQRIFKGLSAPLVGTYSNIVMKEKKTIAFGNAHEMSKLTSLYSYNTFKHETFIGTPIFVHGNLYGSLSYSSTKPRITGFSDQEVRFVEIIAQIISKKLEVLDVKNRSAMSRSRLQESLSRFEALTELVPVGIVLIDPDGQNTYVNPKMLELTGSTFEEVTKNGILSFIHDEDKRELEDLWSEAFVAKKYFEHEFRVEHKKTHKCSAVISKATPLLTSDDEFFGFVVVNIDVTTQKETEMKLKGAKMKALEASEAKTSFLSNMSHEIRTPLNSIIGLSGLLAQSQLTDEQKDYVKVLENSSEHLLHLINDILDLSKIEAREIRLETAPFDFKAKIKEASDLFAWQLQEKRLKLNYQVQDSLSPAYAGDASRISQILINVLGNAIKFTSVGLIKVTLAENTTSARGNLLLTITDTGIGIPQEQQGQIFEAFKQGESSISKKFGGTGLGLAITRRLVDLMGGDIWVKSVPGEGSSFFLTFNLTPIAAHNGQVSVAMIDKKEALEKLKTLPLEILLVDDAINNRNLIIAYLKGFPFTITQAQNGVEALEKMKLKSYDLVLMDVQMPEMDGLTAIRHYREWESSHRKDRQLVIALTAYALQEEQRKCYEAGFDEHLSKPIKKDTLLEGIVKKIQPLKHSA